MLAASALVGCLDNSGNDPPSGVLNFPNAMATKTLDEAAGPRFLYVANSNFDLRFNSATLQSYDLEVANDAIDTLCTPVLPPPGCRGPIPAACVTDPNGAACMAITEPVHDGCALVRTGSRQASLPAGVLRVCEVGPADPNAPGGLLVDEVRIGSFADGMALSTDRARLYVAVRSDSDVTRIDLDDTGRLDCIGGGFETRNEECTDAYRRSDRSVASSRDLELPPDPVAIAVGSLADFPGHDAAEGDWIVMAHRAGSMSFFVDPRTGPEVALLDVLDGFPTSISVLAREPDSGLLWGPSAVGGQMARAGIVPTEQPEDPGADDEGFLFNAGALTSPSLPVGSAGDVRDVVFDPRPGVDRAYVVSRAPSGLLIANRTPAVDRLLVPALEVIDEVRLGSGPSRIAIAELATSSGPRMFGFVSCFDSRNVYIVDLDLAEVVAVSQEFSGPFEIEIDPVRRRFYVIDFRTSVVRIVDLDPLLACLDGTASPDAECAPSLAGLIGVPDAAEELE